MNLFRSNRLVVAALLLSGVPLLAADPKTGPQKSPSDRQDAPRASAAGQEDSQPNPERKSGRAADKVPDVVDINTATQAQLEAHPMIGPMAAKSIVAARPFASLDDLSRLQGLSAERIEQIRLVVNAPSLAAESPAPDRAGPEHNQVDVNTADRATLEALPSVGPDLADAIIAARPFARIDDLDVIKGISAERLEQMRTELMVATPQAAVTKKGTRKKNASPATKTDELSPTGRPSTEPRR